MSWRGLPLPTRTAASRARPSRTRVSASRRASRSVPGQPAWVTWPRARASPVGFPVSCSRMTQRPCEVSHARRRARLASARSASTPSPRHESSLGRGGRSWSRAGLPRDRTGAPPPPERIVCPWNAALSPVPGTSSHSASRTVMVVESTMDPSCTPPSGPGRSTGCARASASARGPGRHAPFQGRVAPPLARGARHPWHLRCEVGTQDVRLLGAAWCPHREDHRPHQHPQVPLTVALDHPTRLAQAVSPPAAAAARTRRGPHPRSCAVSPGLAGHR